MPASSSEGRTGWGKRKRENPATQRSKLQESENDEAFEENEDEDDPDLDPLQNHLETEDDPHNQSSVRTSQVPREKESEKLVDGGLKICDFPVTIKRVVNRPHSLVFGIVEAEKASQNGESRGHGQGGVAVLENISYGQLLALSAVPRDSPALLGSPMEEPASESDVGSHVIVPPPVIPGRGIIKRFGSKSRVHVVPVHADWFSPNSVHRLERQVVPHFFSGKSAEHTPEKYMEGRNYIVAKYMENPEKHLSVVDCQGLVAGFDSEDLTRILRFLVHWGIINYCATPLKHEAPKWKKMEGLGVCSSRRQLGKKRQREEVSSVEARETLTRQIPVKPFNQNPKVSFILDNDAIKKAFIKKRWVVANGLDDEAALRRQNKNPDDYMTQITHEVLKAILDSPLNRYGLIGAVYVKIANGVLFEVKPHVRIPRTLPRFSGLMLELLEKSRIRTNETQETLMRVVEEPVTRHLPAASRIIGISKRSYKLVDVADFVNVMSDDMHLVFMVGTSASEDINQQYTDDIISVTDYPVDPVASIDLICDACEQKWKTF